MIRFTLPLREKDTMASQNEEIDLIELFARVVLILKRNFTLILSAFLVGLTLGILFYQFAPKTYGSNMLISSELLTESYCKEIIQTINLTIRDKNYNELSARLGITPEQAASLGKLGVKSAIEKSDGVQEKEKIYLRLSAEVKDNAVLEPLQKGLVHYFESNEFVKIRVEAKRNLHASLIARIKKEIEDLEKVKQQLLEGKPGKEAMTLDPSAANVAIVDLTKLMMENEEKLAVVNSFQIVEGFTIYRDPVSPKFSFSIAGGVTLGLFFAIAVIVFKGIRSMLRFSEQKLGQS